MHTPMRRGFTLIEMLVVIIIIGILAAILVPTIGRAVRQAKNSRIGIEINSLSSAVEAYKQKYTDYPPDFSNRALVERHIRKAFPKISAQEFAQAQRLFWSGTQSRVDPAEALVFWLGGFSADPRRPFTGPGGPFLPGSQFAINPDRNAPLFPFDEARLSIYLADPSNGNPSPTGVPLSNDEFVLHTANNSDNDRFPVFYPKELGTPYVYLDARSYGGTASVAAPRYPPAVYATTTSVKGLAVAYFSDLGTQRFMNKQTFQIISAGLDNDYGVAGGSFPSGSGYSYENRDNLTNFSEGSTLEDLVP